MLNDNRMREKLGQEKVAPGFATVVDVEQHFQVARNVTGSLVLAYMPLIEASDLDQWRNYSQANQGWIAESNQVDTADPILPNIWEYPPDGDRRRMDGCGGGVRRRLQEDEADTRMPLTADQGPFAPVWTLSPPPLPNDTNIINFNLFAKPVFEKAVHFIEKSRKPTFLDVCNQAAWFDNRNHAEELQTVIAYPVFENFETNAKIVGHLTAIIPWRVFFEDIVATGSEPIDIVLENTCDEVFQFQVKGHQAALVDESDTHDPQYDYLKLSQTFADFANPKGLQDHDICVYTISAYPTQEMEDNSLTNEPIIYALVVLLAFLSFVLFFTFFDCLMQRRHARVMDTARKHNAIVSSLFPKNVQAQMMAQVEEKTLSKVGRTRLKNYLGGEETNGSTVDKSKPIADLFPATTIMFADLTGFTAWASTREPSAVFTLLETIYHAFDGIAKRRRVSIHASDSLPCSWCQWPSFLIAFQPCVVLVSVLQVFKVEVVGDCYVAVCGLPDPQANHAVIMAKFAHECLETMLVLVKELEVELGPDTADLGLRVGLHSGPVIAGVLRGEKSRFQLFGDTMNTASRMESHGLPNRIQISQATAELLIAANKENWCIPRKDKIKAKGKGELSTFWLEPGSAATTSGVAQSSKSSVGTRSRSLLNSLEVGKCAADTGKKNRIADWTSEVLACLLKEIARRRLASGVRGEDCSRIEKSVGNNSSSTVIDEVKEIIELPEYNATVARKEQAVDPTSVQLSPEVWEELREYVRAMSMLYHDNRK